jgi:hypothetical protein
MPDISQLNIVIDFIKVGLVLAETKTCGITIGSHGNGDASLILKEHLILWVNLSFLTPTDRAGQ